jgi:pimeloyl-ACP methyl ester carboxylesterase
MTMSTLALVGSSAPVPPNGTVAGGKLQLQVEDALASGRRLWIRGQIRNLIPPSDLPSPKRRWWTRWRRNGHPNGQVQTGPLPDRLTLETRISGAVWQSEIPLAADGRFDALLSVDFPQDRPGWRTARYGASVGPQAAEACGVVLRPLTGGKSAVVVFLPLKYTTTATGIQQLADPKLAPRLNELLQVVVPTRDPHALIFYLACVPSGGPSSAELALAATTLGWPGGDFVLLPAERGQEVAALAEGLERLRWLFAESLELELLNLEPMMTPSLFSLAASRTDRAAVRLLANPEEKAHSGHRPRLSYNRIISIRPSRAGLVPRHPVVFCHGMLAFSMLKMQIPDNLNCFSPLRETLRERGIPVLFPQVPPTSGVAERAEQLRDQIRHWTTEPVNLIAHSMGGLDARCLIAHMGMGHQVASLTTVSTPHRGSYLADWFLANYRQRVPLLLALEAVGINVDGFKDCRPAVCRKFNEENPDHPKVRYFSYGGDVPQSRLSPFLRRAWNILTPIEGPNDGMVSVASANWGEYLGSIHADHFAQTPDATFIRVGEDFDSIGFFANLVEALAHRGF